MLEMISLPGTWLLAKVFGRAEFLLKKETNYTALRPINYTLPINLFIKGVVSLVRTDLIGKFGWLWRQNYSSLIESQRSTTYVLRSDYFCITIELHNFFVFSNIKNDICCGKNVYFSFVIVFEVNPLTKSQQLTVTDLINKDNLHLMM